MPVQSTITDLTPGLAVKTHGRGNILIKTTKDGSFIKIKQLFHPNNVDLSMHFHFKNIGSFLIFHPDF